MGLLHKAEALLQQEMQQKMREQHEQARQRKAQSAKKAGGKPSRLLITIKAQIARLAGLLKRKGRQKPVLRQAAEKPAEKQEKPAAKRAAKEEKPGAEQAKRQRFFTKLILNLVFTIAVFAGIAAVIMKKKNIALGPWFWVLVALIAATLILALLSLKMGKRIRQRIQAFAAPAIFKGAYKTDIDRLYELIQRKRSVRLSEVIKEFSIDKKKSEEWATILEDNNLITIHYPAFGEQELRLKEK